MSDLASRTPITHVAVRFRGVTYSLPAPNRHHHVIMHIARVTGAETIDSHGEDQGFLDASGRYLTRKQALVIARACDQILPNAEIAEYGFFSEDVW